MQTKAGCASWRLLWSEGIEWRERGREVRNQLLRAPSRLTQASSVSLSATW